MKERLLTLYVACTVGMLSQGRCLENYICMLPVHSALTLVGPPSVWQQCNVTTAQRMGSLPPKGEAQQLHKVGNIEEGVVPTFAQESSEA